MILFPNENWDAVIEQLKLTKHVMLTTHRNSDADGIGSQIALGHTLRNMGKKVTMFNHDKVPRICQYLSLSEDISTGEHPDVSDVDTIVALDAGAMSRLGFPPSLYTDKCLINIDHHASNPLYADINVVNADYCATGAMVFDLIQHLGQPLDKISASAIYAAILTDTASFHLDKVDADVHRMTAELIDAGADPALAADKIYDSQPLERITLLTHALQTLSLSHDGRTAWMHVDQTMIDASGASDEDTEGFIDVSRSVQGVEIVAFIRPESEGRWKVSFRGKEGRDVGAIAVELGGGGHRYASGSAVSGSLEEVYAKIRSVIDTRFL